MQVIRLGNSGQLGPLALTIGNFDGVHLGHQQLVKATTQWALANSVSSAVVTFQPHPMEVIAPETGHSRIFDFEDQRKQLQALGVDFLIIEKFSRELSEMKPASFLENWLGEQFDIRHLVVGYDFRFGYRREGDILLLEKFCLAKKISLQVIPALKQGEVVVSTTNIRKALGAGEVEAAASLLGRKYYLKGLVEKGEGRGRQLGFPTANIHPELKFFPKMGVYVSQLKLHGQIYPSVTNIGINRSFVEGENHPLRIETHILNFNQSIYGEPVEIELLHYLREEKKFEKIQMLTEQIGKDLVQAQNYFTGCTM